MLAMPIQSGQLLFNRPLFRRRIERSELVLDEALEMQRAAEWAHYLFRVAESDCVYLLVTRDSLKYIVDSDV